mgnify:CR=1 FL=1
MNLRPDSEKKEHMPRPQVDYFDPDDVDLLVLLQGLKTQKLTLLIATLLGFLVGFVYISVIPPVYQANANIKAARSLNIAIDVGVFPMNKGHAFQRALADFQSAEFRERLRLAAEAKSPAHAESWPTMKFTAFSTFALVSIQSTDQEIASAGLKALMERAREYTGEQIANDYIEAIDSRAEALQIKLDARLAIDDVFQNSDLEALTRRLSATGADTPSATDTVALSEDMAYRYYQGLLNLRAEIQYLERLKSQDFSQVRPFQFGEITTVFPKLIKSSSVFLLGFAAACGLFAGLLFAVWKTRTENKPH